MPNLFYSTTSKKSEFNFDLCIAMLAANILLSKLSNPIFRCFLAKYIVKVSMLNLHCKVYILIKMLHQSHE